MRKEDFVPMEITVTVDDKGQSKPDDTMEPGIATKRGQTIIAALDEGEKTSVLICGAFSQATIMRAIGLILKNTAQEHKQAVDLAIAMYKSESSDFAGLLMDLLSTKD